MIVPLPIEPTEVLAIVAVFWIVAREGSALIRWLIERRNGGRSVGQSGCSAGVEKLLQKLVLIQEGQQRRLDSLDDAVRAIPTSNHQLVMEIVTIMRGVGAGGP